MRLNRSCVQLIVIRCVDHIANTRRLFIDIGITTRVLFESFIVVGEENTVTSLTRSGARPIGETKGILLVRLNIAGTIRLSTRQNKRRKRGISE